jgi:inorganic pyrophosphatase
MLLTANFSRSPDAGGLAGRSLAKTRLLGVAAESRAYREIRNLRDIPAHLLDEIEYFFVSYNKARGRRFRVVRRVGPEAAKRLVTASERRFESERAETQAGSRVR